MSKSDAFETALLLLLFNNTAIANIGDATGLPGSAVAGDFHVSAHTADPGEAGDQTTNEAAWGTYARVAVPRAAVTGWTVAGDTADNAVQISHPKRDAGDAGTTTVTHFGIGTAATLAGFLLYSGPLDASLDVVPNVQLIYPIGDLNVQEL